MIDPRIVYRSFGTLVRDHRKRMHFTQADLAKRVGLSRTSITNIENGRQRILFHQVFDFAQALEIRSEALLPVFDMIPEEENSRDKTKLDAKIHETLSKQEKQWILRVVR